MRRFGLEYRESDGPAVYQEIPTWGPYPGVTEALRRLAEEYPRGARRGEAGARGVIGPQGFSGSIRVT